jgi:hypothetical protein
MTTREELFKKYHIDESHNKWDSEIDNWMSVEIYRLMNDGKLPDKKEASIKWVYDFLDKMKSTEYVKELMNRKDWGSLYLTAKRLAYKHTA